VDFPSALILCTHPCGLKGRAPVRFHWGFTIELRIRMAEEEFHD
jgi:hypothetical protein